MINNEANEVKKELFDLLKDRYQSNLESIKGSEFVFDCIDLMYYKYKMNLTRGGSYVNSPDSIKNKQI